MEAQVILQVHFLLKEVMGVTALDRLISPVVEVAVPLLLVAPLLVLALEAMAETGPHLVFLVEALLMPEVVVVLPMAQQGALEDQAVAVLEE
jgi:hypothetical protein